MNINNIRWIDKYQPKRIEDLILPERISKQLYPNTSMIFYGPAGCGKTSAALAKSKNSLLIRCSLDKENPEKVRSRILEFILGYSLIEDENSVKTVIIDEVDGVSDQFIKSLRGVIDAYPHIVWILTTNYYNKVSSSIGVSSRFTAIDFSLTDGEVNDFKKQYTRKLVDIALAEKVNIKKHALEKLVNKKYPDFRSAIISLQFLHTVSQGNEITLEDIDKTITSFEELYNKICEHSKDAELFSYVLTNYSTKVDDVFLSLGGEFIQHLINKNKENIIGECSIIIHKYSYESRFCVDKPLALYCCIKNLNNICK